MKINQLKLEYTLEGVHTLIMYYQSIKRKDNVYHF